MVKTGSHTSSAIADMMLPELGGPGYERLMVVMPDKVGVFGDGGAIEALAAAYPGSWWGGDQPTAGYWGMALSSDREDLIAELIKRLR